MPKFLFSIAKVDYEAVEVEAKNKEEASWKLSEYCQKFGSKFDDLEIHEIKPKDKKFCGEIKKLKTKKK